MICGIAQKLKTTFEIKKMINVKLYILSNAREGVGSTLFNPAYRSVFYLTTMYSDFCQVIRCCSEIVSLILEAL